MNPAAAPSAALSPAMRASQLAAFLVPGVALSLPSGYSVGAAALALASLIFVRQWWGRSWDRRALVLACMLATMAVMWTMSFDDWHLRSRSDQFVKYALAITGLGFLQAFAPRVRPLGWGMLAGALGAGLVAVYQMGWTDAHRANGFIGQKAQGRPRIAREFECGAHQPSVLDAQGSPEPSAGP